MTVLNDGRLDTYVGIHCYYYLVMGTGNACAWQSNAKLELLGFTNILILESDENVGGFVPMGSKTYLVKSQNKIKKVLYALNEGTVKDCMFTSI